MACQETMKKSIWPNIVFSKVSLPMSQLKCPSVWIFFNAVPASFRVIQMRPAYGASAQAFKSMLDSGLVHTVGWQNPVIILRWSFMSWLLLEEGKLGPLAVPLTQSQGPPQIGPVGDLAGSLQTAPPQPGEQVDPQRDLCTSTCGLSVNQAKCVRHWSCWSVNKL